MNKTVVIQIGNSDDKLSQVEWHQYVHKVHEALKQYGNLHFFGGSSTFDPWQNVCFVLETADHLVEQLKSQLFYIRKNYRQNSVAIATGEIQFV